MTGCEASEAAVLCWEGLACMLCSTIRVFMRWISWSYHLMYLRSARLLSAILSPFCPRPLSELSALSWLSPGALACSPDLSGSLRPFKACETSLLATCGSGLTTLWPVCCARDVSYAPGFSDGRPSCRCATNSAKAFCACWSGSFRPPWDRSCCKIWLCMGERSFGTIFPKLCVSLTLFLSLRPAA